MFNKLFSMACAGGVDLWLAYIFLSNQNGPALFYWVAVVFLVSALVEMRLSPEDTTYARLILLETRFYTNLLVGVFFLLCAPHSWILAVAAGGLLLCAVFYRLRANKRRREYSAEVTRILAKA